MTKNNGQPTLVAEIGEMPYDSGLPGSSDSAQNEIFQFFDGRRHFRHRVAKSLLVQQLDCESLRCVAVFDCRAAGSNDAPRKIVISG